MAQIRARYFDGKTAHGHEVSVHPQAGQLSIRSPEGTVLARWPLAETEQVDDQRGEGPVALLCRAAPDARLILADRAGLQMLRRLAPELAATERSRRRRGLQSVLAAAVAAMVAVVVVFEFSPRWLGQAIPSSWLAPLGASYIAGLAEQHPVCANPLARSALERLATRLAAAQGHDGSIAVDILNWGELNAFALPGDRIVVLSGLIRDTAPDELAGVLAHEVGHVVERHVNENLVRALGASLLVQLVTGGGGSGGGPAGVVALLAQLAYSRAAEAEADRAAIQALTSEGLRASGLHRFLARLEQEPGAGLIPAWFSTHPSSVERAAAMPVEDGGGDPFSADEWRQIQSACE